ncbi:trehalose-phosphatase [Frateuria aurantia]
MQAARILTAPPLPVAGDAWALFLDVDGTLLPFRERPEQVTVPPPLQSLLGALYQALDGAMALVSGRPIEELQQLFGAPPWPLAGLHGLELKLPDGRVRQTPVKPESIKQLRHSAMLVAEELPGVRLEDKGIAVALHCRAAPSHYDALLIACEQAVQNLPGFELQPGNLVVEIKPAAMKKGHAVQSLMEVPPFLGRRPVYLGDDLTDEHAFATVNLENGITTRVGTREPTLAQFALRDPVDVLSWLSRLLDAIVQGDPLYARHPTGRPH